MENNPDGPRRPYQLPFVVPNMSYASRHAAPAAPGNVHPTPVCYPLPAPLQPAVGAVEPAQPATGPIQPAMPRTRPKPPGPASSKPKKTIQKSRKSKRGPKAPAKKTQGRKKIKIEFMQENRPRQVSFLKRKNGVLKKAYELSVLTGCETAVVIFNNDNKKLYEFMSTSAEHTLERYANYMGPSERRLPITTDGKGVSTTQPQATVPSSRTGGVKKAPSPTLNQLRVANIVQPTSLTPLQPQIGGAGGRSAFPVASRAPDMLSLPGHAAVGEGSMYGGPALPPLSSLLAATHHRASFSGPATPRTPSQDVWEYPALRQPLAEVSEFESHPTLAPRLPVPASQASRLSDWNRAAAARGRMQSGAKNVSRNGAS